MPPKLADPATEKLQQNLTTKRFLFITLGAHPISKFVAFTEPFGRYFGRSFADFVKTVSDV